MINFIRKLFFRIIGVCLVLVGLNCIFSSSFGIIGFMVGLIFSISGIIAIITGKDPNTILRGNGGRRSHEHMQQQMHQRMHDDFIRQQDEICRKSCEEGINNLNNMHQEMNDNMQQQMNNNMHNNF